MSDWRIYMVRCVDGTLYTGITTDIKRRLAQHNGVTKGGARYTRCRRPVELVWAEQCEDRSEASRREHAVKKLTRQEKLTLITLMAGVVQGHHDAEFINKPERRS